MSFAVDRSMSRYAVAAADGKLPAIPRTAGATPVSAPAAASPGAVVAKLVPKADVAAALGGGAAGADAAAEGGVAVTYAAGARTLVVPAGKGSAADVRAAAAAAVAKARALKLTAPLALDLSALAAGGAGAAAQGAAAQGGALAAYSFARYLTGEGKAPHALAGLEVLCPGGPAEAAAVAASARAVEGVVVARDCGNERADEMHPDRVEAVARAVAAEAGMAVFTIVGEELLAAGMHMHYSVGQGARYQPRYIELLHKGDPAHPDDVIAVVGKGICFDSGGLNIKPTGSMEDMHIDKQGACNVLGIALAVGRLKLPRNIVFVLAVAENAVDALSYKPHNIMRSKKGLTVTNGNTDAEGRLVLGDSLYAVQERHRPHSIIDMATLTGACVVALGEHAAGGFGNSRALREAVIAAGAARGETIWHMPILPQHTAELTACAFADLKSTAGRMGGACTAAAFLQQFIGLNKDADKDGAYKPAWLHLDIAGPGMIKGHATGFGTMTVIEFLTNAPAGAAFAQDEAA